MERKDSFREAEGEEAVAGEVINSGSLIEDENKQTLLIFGLRGKGLYLVRI